ncbi:MAG: coagulation factor 5/8 type domain-containing protein [Ignavibacteria bacterium]|nr:MAG: coagulation factor 5/8 type domain-containing protein [Ignavibacteria bacterium]KAF0161786.1 MAG: coagulation factor 5/8 type domain-containing protein [Ignavibacteria bacterium]
MFKRCFMLLFVVGFLNSSNNTFAQKKDLVPIKLDLPKPMFVGTPTNLSVPNLEKPLGKPRPPFYAPKGVENVALKKPVTSSDMYPVIGELSYITNGKKDASDGNFVELGPFQQNIVIDLKKDYNIYAIVVWHYHMQARVYYDVIVQVADDAKFTKNVRTLFNNDLDNSSKQGKGKDLHYVETSEGKLIDAKGENARYVRLFSKGSTADDLNHYIEVAVYGK